MRKGLDTGDCIADRACSQTKVVRYPSHCKVPLRCCAAGFTIEAQPHGGSGCHALGVCFVADGLYRLQLCDVAVQIDAAGQKTQASTTIAAQVPSVSLHSMCIVVR